MALGHDLALPHSIGVCDGLIRVIDSGSESESCFSPQRRMEAFYSCCSLGDFTS